jgi:diguanylate cyclase
MLSSVSPSVLLSQLVDDYIGWLVAWHRLTSANTGSHKDVPPELNPPASFAAWRENASASLPQDQPVIERLAMQHEQLHTLARLVLMKTPEEQSVARKDDDGVIAKYRELMQGLRRLERAFAAAASDLDPLTGLRTRAGLLRDLEREISRFTRTDRPFCVAIADIDHFKNVNDTYGHDAGDRVLASIADHISRSLRAHDDAFRLGGEEFLLCLKEADLAAGLTVVERLRKGLREKPIAVAEGKAVPVTVSFGLTVCGRGVTAHELLRRADVALYRAKSEGRNRVVVAEG